MNTTSIHDMHDADLVSYLHLHIDEIAEKHHNFLQSCSRGIQQYGSLTWKMRSYAKRLGSEVQQKPIREAVKELPNLAGVYAIFLTASEKLKRPAVTFDSPSLGKIKIAVAGDRSKYTGQLMVTDGGPFGQNQWFGRIDSNGVFKAGRSMLNDAQMTFLKRFSEDPVTLAKEYAMESGACCFCHRQLTDDRSTEVGYGPVCAKNYGLPWGTKELAA